MIACLSWSVIEISLLQGSLDYQFLGRNQTMQMNGNSEWFALKSALFGLVI